MLPLIAIGLGITCALISRVLLLIAAVRVSVAWTIGVLFPFGPLFFRIHYPEEARRSMIFRYLTVAFLAFYLIEESGPALAQLKDNKIRSDARLSPRPGDMLYYGTEGSSATTGAAPSQPTFNLEQRRTANDDELVRLRKWYDELKMRKRDLLHSDVQGNREYVVDLALYNEALAKAMTERNALDALAK